MLLTLTTYQILLLVKSSSRPRMESIPEKFCLREFYETEQNFRVRSLQGPIDQKSDGIGSETRVGALELPKSSIGNGGERPYSLMGPSSAIAVHPHDGCTYQTQC